MYWLRPFHTLKKAGVYWAEDQASQMGAALAYYSLFSLAPTLIIGIAIAGFFYGEEAAKGQVVARIRDFIGPESASTVQTQLENFRHPHTGHGAALIGIGTLWFGAMGVFTQLRSSLSRIWRTKLRPQPVLIGLGKDYLLAFIMVLVSSVFVMALLVASAVMTVLLEWWTRFVPWMMWAWPLADFGTSSLLVGLMFAFTYRFMSVRQIRYRHIWGGAAVAAGLFAIGKLLLGYYLGQMFLASAYGAAGSLVIFLVWVYYSAQIFFFGAEVIRVRCEEHDRSSMASR